MGLLKVRVRIVLGVMLCKTICCMRKLLTNIARSTYVAKNAHDPGCYLDSEPSRIC